MTFAKAFDSSSRYIVLKLVTRIIREQKKKLVVTILNIVIERFED